MQQWPLWPGQMPGRVTLGQRMGVNPVQKGSIEPPPKPNNETNSVKPAPSPKMTHSVQVGAFLKHDYAKRLVGQLKVKSHPAQIVPVKDSKGRSWYTVRIGNYSSKEAAQAQADAFSAFEKMETAVRPFGKL